LLPTRGILFLRRRLRNFWRRHRTGARFVYFRINRRSNNIPWVRRKLSEVLAVVQFFLALLALFFFLFLELEQFFL
jgi:hypothetical protein